MNKNVKKTTQQSRSPNRLFSTFVFALIVFMGITGCIDGPSNGSTYFKYSFEEDLEGWGPDGTDLDDPPIE